jgi:hypothetical protein
MPVTVVYPGHRGGSAGPDYRDAVVQVGGEERRGDVELHVRASYFHGHGHHLDPAYDGVVLHVVYLADEGPLTLLSNGGATPVAALAPWLARREAELRRWLEGPPLWREPCQDAVLRLGEAALVEALTVAGRARFEVRIDRLRAAVARDGAEVALWRALADAVAYGGDREAFGRLARAFSPTLARELATYGVEVLSAALVAVAGLMPVPSALAGRLPAPIWPPPRGGSRPAGRPERRIEALARLFVRAGADLAGYAMHTVGQASSAAALVKAWQAPGLGQERAGEIVLNLVLPFASLSEELGAQAASLLAGLRSSAPYGKTAFLEHNLRDAKGRRLAKTALAQQGLLALLSEWCSQGGCGRCPLSPPP